MNIDIILQNMLNPPVLFFILGMLAVFLKSELAIPQPLPKLFSLYLLIAIGLHGGYELSESGFNFYIFEALMIAVVMATIVPIYSFYILKIKMDVYNSIAIASTYGSHQCCYIHYRYHIPKYYRCRVWRIHGRLYGSYGITCDSYRSSICSPFYKTL